MMAKPNAPLTDPKRLSEPELHQIDSYWRAANFLTIGQIGLRLVKNQVSRSPRRRGTSISTKMCTRSVSRLYRLQWSRRGRHA